MKPIDIFITAYLRPEYTRRTIQYLRDRTDYPYRLFLIDNGGNANVPQAFPQGFMHYINLGENMGIHAAWNVALSLAESEYFITSDNDIYVPETRHMADDGTIDPNNIYSDWLSRMVNFMDDKHNFGAISLHPHVFIGIAGEDPKDPEQVKEAPMCGAVMRIMQTEVVRQVGGWEHKIDPKRNHEERWICSRLQTAGYKVGRTTRIRAYHPFGGEAGNWGYPPEITPEMQGHNPDLEGYVKGFDRPEAYDSNTWLPK